MYIHIHIHIYTYMYQEHSSGEEDLCLEGTKGSAPRVSRAKLETVPVTDRN